MERWCKTWRANIAPKISTAGLTALRAAIVTDDPTLIQRSAYRPQRTKHNDGAPVEGACAACYGAWKDGLTTVGELAAFFNGTELTAGFWEWWDLTPRPEALAALLPEVGRALTERAP